MEALIYILLSSIAVFVTAQVLPGVHVEGFGTALVVAVVLGLLNAVIRPIVLILTLPINILTLGLFTVVIMGFMVYLVAAIVPGFTVDSFLWAIGFSLVLAIVGAFINALTFDA